MTPNVSDILGSDVRIGYGVAEVLASTITSTVEGGCIRPANVISRLMHCWYPIGDEMKTQRLIDREKGVPTRKLVMSNLTSGDDWYPRAER